MASVIQPPLEVNLPRLGPLGLRPEAAPLVRDGETGAKWNRIGIAVSALRNRRKEQFAIEWAGGKTPIEAMAAAGYKPAPANARKLANSPEVKARRSELFRQHADFLSADIARVLIEQTRIAYANMADFWERTPEGGWKLKDLTTLPREVMAAVREIKIGKDGEPTIKLHDKVGALQALQRYLDPDPLPPGQKLDKPAADAPPVYDAGDDWDELTGTKQPALN